MYAAGKQLPRKVLTSAFFPRYLRKAFFPKHQDLQFAGMAGVPGSSLGTETFSSPTYRSGRMGLRVGPGPDITPTPIPCSGILNPLDSPHHMRQDEESAFREGVVVDRPTKAGHGSLVNCGMKKVGMEVGCVHLEDTRYLWRTDRDICRGRPGL